MSGSGRRVPAGVTSRPHSLHLRRQVPRRRGLRLGLTLRRARGDTGPRIKEPDVGGGRRFSSGPGPADGGWVRWPRAQGCDGARHAFGSSVGPRVRRDAPRRPRRWRGQFRSGWAGPGKGHGCVRPITPVLGYLSSGAALCDPATTQMRKFRRLTGPLQTYNLIALRKSRDCSYKTENTVEKGSLRVCFVDVCRQSLHLFVKPLDTV